MPSWQKLSYPKGDGRWLPIKGSGITFGCLVSDLVSSYTLSQLCAWKCWYFCIFINFAEEVISAAIIPLPSLTWVNDTLLSTSGASLSPSLTLDLLLTQHLCLPMWSSRHTAKKELTSQTKSWTTLRNTAPLSLGRYLWCSWFFFRQKGLGLVWPQLCARVAGKKREHCGK